jgi:uncharacterized protein
MTTADVRIHAIYRYPVKGLSPEPLSTTTLAIGKTIPADRLYAIENGPSEFDPLVPTYLPKQRFLMLMRNERLASLDSRFDETEHLLSIRQGGREVAKGNLLTAAGRGNIETFFAAFCADELRGPPKILHARDHSFSDVARKVVSIVNLASVAAVESAIGSPVDPLRFRANIYIDGWRAWHEFDLLNREVKIGGDTRLKIVKRIVRCAATCVEPGTGIRDLAIPETLMRSFGHGDCGVYADVVGAGPIAVGDSVSTIDS